MTSAISISNDTKALYKNVIQPKPTQSIVISPKPQNNDTFEKQSQTENKPFIKKVKDYLFTPIDNPKYEKAYGRQKTTRFENLIGMAAIIAMYSFLFFDIRKGNEKLENTIASTRKIDSAIEKYRENLSKAPRLSDLALPDKLAQTVNTVMNKINNPEAYIQKGGKIKNTILLYGPPGTGKTTFAKAITRELKNAELLSIDLSTIQNKYIGQSEANLDKAIREVCRYAQENPAKKIVVLMDEFDSIAVKDNGSSNQQYHASILNVLKKAINDRLTQHENIILIATTNAEIEKTQGSGWVQTLDSAIVDRFGEKIRVERPTKEQFTKAIIKRYANLEYVEDCLKQENSKEVNEIAESLVKNKCSFRTLENLFNASAATSKGEKLTFEDILSALKGCIESSKEELPKKDIHIAGFAG